MTFLLFWLRTMGETLVVIALITALFLAGVAVHYCVARIAGDAAAFFAVAFLAITLLAAFVRYADGR